VPEEVHQPKELALSTSK